ncbi:MAG: hypothetical protein ACXAB0_11980 [Candidatus Thorarchaeota archaeon]
MWEEIPEEPEYIQVCDSYQLAAMLGIIGVIIGIALTFLNEAIWFNYYENPEFDLEMLSILFNMLNPIGFVGGILVSVGFVGVFAMKKSTVGILFPLIFLASLFISRILFWISISISIDSYLFIINNVLSLPLLVVWLYYQFGKQVLTLIFSTRLQRSICLGVFSYGQYTCSSMEFQYQLKVDSVAWSQFSLIWFLV